MSGYTAIETEVIVDTTFAFFRSESSTTTATAAFLSSVLSERRGSWESIDLRFFFQDFSNVWILVLETSRRASEGAPILIEFSSFLHKSGQCSWHQR